MSTEQTIDVLPAVQEIEELAIVVKRTDSPERSHLRWTEKELRFASTRRSVIMILRGMALKLEGEG